LYRCIIFLFIGLAACLFIWGLYLFYKYIVRYLCSVYIVKQSIKSWNWIVNCIIFFNKGRTLLFNFHTDSACS
jgi:hypothetical protein